MALVLMNGWHSLSIIDSIAKHSFYYLSMRNISLLLLKSNDALWMAWHAFKPLASDHSKCGREKLWWNWFYTSIQRRRQGALDDSLNLVDMGSLHCLVGYHNFHWTGIESSFKYTPNRVKCWVYFRQTENHELQRENMLWNDNSFPLYIIFVSPILCRTML